MEAIPFSAKGNNSRYRRLLSSHHAFNNCRKDINIHLTGRYLYASYQQPSTLHKCSHSRIGFPPPESQPTGYRKAGKSQSASIGKKICPPSSAPSETFQHAYPIFMRRLCSSHCDPRYACSQSQKETPFRAACHFERNPGTPRYTALATANMGHRCISHQKIL